MNLKNKSNPKDEARRWFLKGVHCVKKYGSLETKEMIDLFDAEWYDHKSTEE